jgi:hypothetical protein
MSKRKPRNRQARKYHPVRRGPTEADAARLQERARELRRHADQLAALAEDAKRAYVLVLRVLAERDNTDVVLPP